ncbi:MAG: hypothetical protein ACRC1P_09650 [Cellulosilyticaceae bacterium]
MKNKPLNKANLERLHTEIKDYPGMKPVRFTRKMIDDLIEKYPYHSMTENKYCCRGLDQCCWQELYEEGIWFYSEEQVISSTKRTVTGVKNYLYTYGRVWMLESDGNVEIFIYTRDVAGRDYWICMSDTEF